jgi:TonB dependent receptor/Carboxypeptidase regulatory-like domain/TonB-dependent Receptor Plug Domain
MRRLALLCLLALLLNTSAARASIFGQVHGVVHDPQHRPIPGAHVELRAANSALTISGLTTQDGSFSIPSVPLGNYTVTISQTGFASIQQPLTLASDTSPILHFELQLDTIQQAVSVSTDINTANINTVTPTTLVSREDIALTPGADRTNSLAMITDYTPGAYITHDMLHMRGGHQVSWLLDGVEIPNTNIASNLAAQIDPKDIDYIEIQRGSYTSDIGDRTYGVFNVVPRTGFERNRQAELILSAGSFLQTNDQLNFGDHSQNFAYYASLSGNRSDYGLSPPTGVVVHDATNGYGGFASLIYNRTPIDQFRFVTQLRNDYFQIPYDPDPNSTGNQQFQSSGLRDGQHESDAIVTFSWLHTINPSTALQVSPFFHYNKADYDSNPNDTPVATTANRSSTYGGAQASITAAIARNTIQAGFYGFGQHDNYLFGAIFNDDSGNANFTTPDSANGAVIEEFVSDNFKATSWLTLIAGLRQTYFTSSSSQAGFTENATAPRFGVAIRIPRLNWVFRGFYGRFYQPPPLLTASGPLVQFANDNNTAFTPLHGEHDEEHQFGVQIPLRGWVIDADTFKTRINNFLDHSNIGDSSIYFPVTIDGALVRAWELSLRSPRLWRFGQAHLAYSNQIAEQRGAITGGLICVPITSPECDTTPSYTPVDHDQRNTLNVGFNATLPFHINTSTNVYYGSGFTNGGFDPDGPPADPKYPNPYLPQHTSVDLSIGKAFGEKLYASVTATNISNYRVLLDNSLTFGGFHFNDPREIFGEIRYRFKY